MDAVEQVLHSGPGATMSPSEEMPEEEVVTRSSAAAMARPPDAFKELLPLMKDPNVVCLLGGAPLPSLFPIANITVTLADGTCIQLDGAATHSAQRYAPFAQDDLLCFCRNQVVQPTQATVRRTVRRKLGSAARLWSV